MEITIEIFLKITSLNAISIVLKVTVYLKLIYLLAKTVDKRQVHGCIENPIPFPMSSRTLWTSSVYFSVSVEYMSIVLQYKAGNTWKPMFDVWTNKDVVAEASTPTCIVARRVHRSRLASNPHGTRFKRI